MRRYHPPMASLRPIPRCAQREEPWANGAGTTTVLLREPDDAGWTVRVSVAKVDHEGPFSELPGTRRTLVPLDAPMTLHFPDGHELDAARFGLLAFAGSPAPSGRLPQGPTRDFNVMLRGSAHADVLPRPLVGSMMLAAAGNPHWLVYLDSGDARIDAGTARVALAPGDAAVVAPGADAGRVLLEGAGEIVLVKLYA